MAPPRPAVGAVVRTRAFRLALLGAVLIGTAGLLSASLTLSHALPPGAFAAMAGQAFGHALTVESVRFELVPWPRIRAEGVEVVGLGRAWAAEVDLRFRPLLRGRVAARAVRLVEPRFVLHRNADGDFLPLFRGRGGATPPTALPRFDVEGGEVRVMQGRKLSAVLRLAALSLGRFDAEGGADLVLRGSLTGGDGRWHARPLSVRGRLVHGPERTRLLDGRARAGHVRAAWWRGRDARVRFRYEDGHIHLERVEAHAFGGFWHAAGRVRLRGGMELDVAARANGVTLAEAVATARPGSEPGPLGVMDVVFDRLVVPWRGGPRWSEGRGPGRLRVRGGALPGRSRFASLVGAEPPPNPVTVLEASVDLRDGRLHSDDARLETADFALDARGSLGLDGTLSLEGRVVQAGAPDVPVTVAGRLRAPRVDAHPSRVPADGLGALASGMKTTGEGVARALGAAGRKALGWLGGQDAAAAP